MERVNNIYNNATYMNCMAQIEECEIDRIFCRHTMVHFMDVARLAHIINLEEEYGVEKEYIYAAALLHDIGRHIQYREGIDHAIASADIAVGIMRECGYNQSEIDEICHAIIKHRDKSVRDERSLAGLIYRADKMSRCCFACKAQQECHKSIDKRRMKI